MITSSIKPLYVEYTVCDFETIFVSNKNSRIEKVIKKQELKVIKHNKKNLRIRNEMESRNIIKQNFRI